MIYKDTITDKEYNSNDLPIQVCKSVAGYYIGRLEPSRCPFDRLSGYFETESKAMSLVGYYKMLERNRYEYI